MTADQTLERLRWFGTFDAGWDYGRGESIDRGVLAAVQRIVESATERGIHESAVFPAPSGEILLAFTPTKQLDIELYVRRDGFVDFSCERDGKTTLEVDNVTEDYALALLDLCAGYKTISLCQPESSITTFTTIPKRGDFAALLSAHPQTEASPLWIGTAPYSTPNQFAITSKNITQTVSPATLHGIGNLPMNSTMFA